MPSLSTGCLDLNLDRVLQSKLVFLAANFVKTIYFMPTLKHFDALGLFFFVSIVFTQNANLVTECATAVIYLFILRVSGHLFGPEDLK